MDAVEAIKRRTEQMIPTDPQLGRVRAGCLQLAVIAEAHQKMCGELRRFTAQIAPEHPAIAAKLSDMLCDADEPIVTAAARLAPAGLPHTRLGNGEYVVDYCD